MHSLVYLHWNIQNLVLMNFLELNYDKELDNINAAIYTNTSNFFFDRLINTTIKQQ